MANISKFDREEVLEKAKNLFWEKGYLGTSTRELQNSINMRPGSIYAAFGNKSALFITVLNHYAQALGEQMQVQVFGQIDVLQAFKTLLRELVLSPNANRPSEMCMLVKTLSELDESHVEILTQVRCLLVNVEAMFAQVLNEAKEQGTLPAQLDVIAAAKTLQVNIIGWRTYLKATGDTETIERQLEQLFAQLALPCH
ncbi:TetR/AcrR family transcriptional regulator [uncultured Paraglaciecola sp.]|uniref:TetR/AcrR family transcriptional regulator n=1 Tax=uncultured Paraglaciecola sp. TaxID=1765024 RepID=UPI0030DB982B|tara:strand:- start:5256 stop:5849 length:594 start_codon:yes stop_codon:yes gene_type:complete